jgi:uncharacterized alpha-E superfamily protein
MLSRVAESIYWMSRYVERAENVARFIDVNLNLMLDAPDGGGRQWQPLVNTTGDHEDFAERCGEPTQSTCRPVLTFDRDNPNSIISCLRAARKRPVGPGNHFFGDVASIEQILSDGQQCRQQPEGFRVPGSLFHRGETLEPSLHRRDRCHHDARRAVAFLPAGTQAGARRQDVAHSRREVLHSPPSVADVGNPPIDDVQWAAVLRSASDFEMYRKRHGRISPKGIVHFLLLDAEFPRAIRFCLNAALDSLRAISGTPPGTLRNDPEKMLGQLCSDLAGAQVDDVVNKGLHEYLDNLQTRMNHVGVGIYETSWQACPDTAKQTG